MEKKLNVLVTAVKELTERIDRMKKKIDHYEAKYIELGNKLEKQESELKELKVKVDAKVEV